MEQYIAQGDIIKGKNNLAVNIHEAVSINLLPIIAIIESYENFTLIIFNALEEMYNECLNAN